MATEREYGWWERLFYGLLCLVVWPVNPIRQGLILTAVNNALVRYRRERWRSR